MVIGFGVVILVLVLIGYMNFSADEVARKINEVCYWVWGILGEGFCAGAWCWYLVIFG